MGMVVRTNTMAVNANRQLSSNNTQVGKSLEKLSSGFRINRAGDDASGLAISEKMKAQIKGLEQASANSQDGISLIQTAEGNLTEVHDMLNRMVELTEKSANGILEDVDRQSIQDEMDALASEIDRIADSANFNNIKLFDGSLSGGKAATATNGEYAKVEVDESWKLGANPGLTTVAATPAKSVLGAVGVVADGQTASFEFTYKDASGESKSLTVSVKGADGAAAQYKVGDGAWTASEDVTTATKAGAAGETGDILMEALSKTELGDLFKMTDVAGAITFTAKEPGETKAQVLVVQQTLDVGGANTKSAIGATPTAGVDAYSQIDFNQVKVWDNLDTIGTTNNSILSNTAKDVIFTVDGQKFAFANAGKEDAARAALGSDVTIITGSSDGTGTAFDETDTIGADAIHDDDVAEMAKAINVKLGYTAVEIDGGDATKLNFNKAKPDTATSAATNGLKLQIGDTNDDYNKLQVSMDDMHMKALFNDDVLEDKDYDGKLGIGKAVLSAEGGLDISTQDKAGAALQSIRKVIDNVSTQRGNLGALQNRLEHTINNLDVTNENMTAANSRIRDTDMAKEMMNYTKMNVLVQSAQAMLAQANQQPQSILQLLQ